MEIHPPEAQPSTRSVYPPRTIAKYRAAAVTVALYTFCLVAAVFAGYAVVTGGAW